MQGAKPGLVAGAAKINITPTQPLGMYLAGFGSQRRCRRVLDPLWARTLVLSDGVEPLVVVALDLIGLSHPRCKKIQARITRRFPNSVWLVSTHNHQSPDTLGLWGPSFADSLPYRSGLDPNYLSMLEERIVQSVQAALKTARPARLHTAEGQFDTRGRFINNERAAEIDRGLRLLQLDDTKGQPIASLIQHACHPASLGAAGHDMSADYCGVCCRQVEKKAGGVALYVNGALGAMVTTRPPGDAPAGMRKLGIALGRATLRLIARARRQAQVEPRIQVRRQAVTLPLDNHFYALLHVMGVVDHRASTRDLETEVSFCTLGPVSLTALPGEAAPALAKEILARLPGKPKLLFSLTNDELGYLLPPEFFHDPRYRYECTMTPSPQTATRLMLAIEQMLD